MTACRRCELLVDDSTQALGHLLLAVYEQTGADSLDELAQTFSDVDAMGADYGVNGFTYYVDTCRFFERHAPAIWLLAADDADDAGTSVLKHLASFRTARTADSWTGFQNLLAWFALERVARYFTNGDHDLDSFRTAFDEAVKLYGELGTP